MIKNKFRRLIWANTRLQECLTDDYGFYPTGDAEQFKVEWGSKYCFLCFFLCTFKCAYSRAYRNILRYICILRKEINNQKSSVSNYLLSVW